MMSTMYKQIIFPLIRNIDAESTHEALLKNLHLVQSQPILRFLTKKIYSVSDPRLNVSIFGLSFENPIGVAAGFDKRGVATRALSLLGFSHVEAGTVTPTPQIGNSKPRLFRLPEDKALINRFGFSNLGIKVLKKNLQSEKKRKYILGLNVGANAINVKEGRAAQDYISCLTELHRHGDYFTINISSPNTQGLRILQAKQNLDDLLKKVFLAVKRNKIKIPILIKIAPDLNEKELFETLEVITSYPIAGIVATNTTIARPKTLKSEYKNETGGLSGVPLRKKSTEIISLIYKHTKGKLPIIGAGGVSTAEHAIEKMKAGASLVQLYTGFIYEGPSIAKNILEGMIAYIDRHKIESIQDIVGTK